MGNQNKLYSDCELEALWQDFLTISVNPKTETIEKSWNGFAKGSSKWSILKWFDYRYTKGVGSLVFK